MKTLYIISGIPGSGKTTLAHKIVNNPDRVCSADNYQVDKDGNYKFDPNKLGYAHKSCQNDAARLMSLSSDIVVIANTNTTVKEMEPYVFLANVHNYNVVLIEPNTPWRYNVDECFQRGTHNVPLDKLKQMLGRLVDLMDAKRHFSNIYPSMNIEIGDSNGFTS